MGTQSIFKQKGVTLIELLVALVICSFVVSAIYRLFVIQTRAYTVQDEVIEVQQTVRSAMEILLRDLRMTGYDDDSLASTVTIPTPAILALQNNSITVSYEYYDSGAAQYQRHDVAYWTDASSTLFRQRTINGVPETREALLENVNALAFTYGIDTDEDGDVDNWVAAGGIGVSKVIAVRVSLSARSTSVNPDVQRRVSPRELTSTIAFRNLTMK